MNLNAENKSNRPVVRLENWSFDINGKLCGDCYNHPRFEDGTRVVTSSILNIVGDVETRNTIYKLGKAFAQSNELEVTKSMGL